MSSNGSTLILVALMVAAFYFLILRPQKKRQQAAQKTMNELTAGTRVLLGSGIFGTIVSVGSRQAVVEVSPGSEITVLKQAIARVATEADEDALDEDEEFDDEPDLVADPAVETSYPQDPAVGTAYTRDSAADTAYTRDSAADTAYTHDPAADTTSYSRESAVEPDRDRKSS